MYSFFHGSSSKQENQDDTQWVEGFQLFFSGDSVVVRGCGIGRVKNAEKGWQKWQCQELP
jgi:hypothetical protein